MTITSTAVQANGTILSDYTCDGSNISPPLTFSEVPPDAKSLVLIFDDPDAPGGTFTHWVLYDMSPATLQIPENDLPLTGKQAVNSFGKTGYGGPCPPDGEHKYRFKLFALDVELGLPEGETADKIESLINGHAIDKAEMAATYRRQ